MDRIDDKPTIVITGIAGRLGRLLARRLHREGRYRVVGIDRRPFEDRPPDIDHRAVDLRSKRTRDVFRKERPQALVHLGIMHDPRSSAKVHHEWNVEGTARLLDYCRMYHVPKVVFLSSHTVYGARPENSQFLEEDAPLLGAQDTPTMRDLVVTDMLCSSFFWKAQDIDTVILRPVHILGRVSNAISNYLRLPRIPTLLGFDPMMQVIHEMDVVEALVLALNPLVRGVFNVPGPGEVPLSVIISELGRPTVPIPHFLAPMAFRTLWRTGLSLFKGTEMNHLRYVCMVDGTRARTELGFLPKHTIKDTIRAVLEGPMR
ncbi:MAG: NAD-dependent epimerase/dehydratase family protein [Deltaproteobacteria bacterium]|nr:NAD-dependent epimerase/dehydratase family protein [Deltaproteobacteria bacterium]